ncbi:MAG: PIG-L family deacetylase [Propionibacteriaceae bacterium]|jgi:N-acetyl-1-D-myo-inositol-2-amino-2-deoxy-alpha-D-glucopyranoside deacetylase|nr:PIG-L family deacetylase [Propionibacteriaceae bacterium]
MKYLFLHAHPDDETLSTGGVIATLTAAGHRVCLVTATRGERGEIRPDVAVGPDGLAALRERELTAACATLGIAARVFLGEPPARAAGLPPRRYEDSGMRWIADGLAGPAADIGPDALTKADLDAAAADLAAAIDCWQPDYLITYDETGGYGHPDHVYCHRLAQRVGEPVDLDLPVDRATLPTVKAALACYPSQLTVVDNQIIHVGGQIEGIDIGRPQTGEASVLSRLRPMDRPHQNDRARFNAAGFLQG